MLGRFLRAHLHLEGCGAHRDAGQQELRSRGCMECPVARSSELKGAADVWLHLEEPLLPQEQL